MSVVRNSVFAVLLAILCTLGLSIGGAKAERRAISVGLVHNPASASLDIGMANGYFAEEGLAAQFEFFDTDMQVEKAVAVGRLDFGAASLTGSFFNYAANHRLKIIASQVSDQTGYPATALLISKKARRGFPQHKGFPAQANRHDYS